MNPFSIIYNLPIGAMVHLRDDGPEENHQVHGYEWFATDANVIFTDGTKLSVKRLELIEKVLSGK